MLEYARLLFSQLLIFLNKYIGTYHHYKSTRTNPQHDFCDPSKCYLYRQKNFDADKHNLPAAVIDALLPVYEKMCSEETLQKVVDGGTTNTNESFHNQIWSLCPKTQFHSAQYVKTSVALAACFYNEGYSWTITKLLAVCGIGRPKAACLRVFHLVDAQRQKEEQKKKPETRQQQRQIRLRQDTSLNSQEKYPYSSGAFD